MKTILDGLEFIKEIKAYDKNIIIALGVNKVALTIKEGFYICHCTLYITLIESMWKLSPKITLEICG